MCHKYPSSCVPISLYTVLKDRECRSAVAMPITASVLSPGCGRAAQCANEARVPVSMVTSPARHPIQQPLVNAIALVGGRERRWRRGTSISKEEPGKSDLACYVCSLYGSPGGSENGNGRHLVPAWQTLGGCWAPPP